MISTANPGTLAIQIGAPTTTTTQDVDVLIKDLRADTDNLNADISAWFREPSVASNQAAKTFTDAWVRWRDAAYAFMSSWENHGVFQLNLAWNFWDNAVVKMNDLIGWAERYEAISGHKPTAPPHRPPGDTAGIWKWVAVAALGAVGAFILFSKIPSLTPRH